MRLTLRTLLAYLDANLPSDQSTELEAKIQQSEAAQQLIARIREVQGRVRLGSPSIHGRGTGGDPNSVAEYLDNRLRSEKTTEIEKICIESDMQLAEVAACHQILSQILGKPLQSPHELRQRLYGIQDLVINEGQPHPDADFVRPAAATNGAAVGTAEANGSHGAWYYLLVGALSLSITLVLLAGGTYLLGGFGSADPQQIADQNDVGTHDPVGEGNGKSAVVVPHDKVPPPGDGDAPEEGPVPPLEAPGEGLAGAASSGPEGTDTEEPRIMVENGAPPAPTSTSTPTDDPSAPPPPTSTPTEGAAPTETPAPPTLEVAAPGPIGSVADVAGAANLVAIFDPQNVDASRLPIDGTIVSGEEYVTFPLFESAVYASPFHFRFLGDSHWGFAAASGATPMTLKLDQGVVRVVADQPAILNVQLNGHVESIRFEEPGTELAVRSSISRFPGDDPRSVVSPHVGDYYLIKGKATLGSTAPSMPLEPAKPMRWTEGVGIAAVDMPAPEEASPASAAAATPAEEADTVPGAPPAPSTPEWVEPTKEPLEEKAVADLLANLPSDRSLKLALTEIALTDDREEMQAVAAWALCSLQYFDAALDSFRDPEQKSYWKETLRAIRRDLPLSQESAEALRTAVENKYPVDAEIVWSMLLGFSPDQLAAGGASELVTSLEHPDQTVRVLAFLDLWEITGITHGYRPEVVENRRRSYVIRWQGTLRNGDVRYLHPPVASQPPQESEEAAPPPPSEEAADEPAIIEESDAPPPPASEGTGASAEDASDAEAPPLP